VGVGNGHAAPRRLGRPPVVLELSASVAAELHARVRAHTATQRDVLRARIILACVGARSAQAVAHDLAINAKTVALWRTRFLQRGLHGLIDRPRTGRPPRVAGATGLEIIAVACEPVPKKPDGTTDRTIDEVREEAVRRGTIDAISWSSVQRLLAGADIRPHHVEGWLHSIDPAFREKSTRICELYVHPPPESVVVCVDEMPGVQARARKYPDHWNRSPGNAPVRRREFEYIRGGTQALIAGFEVKSGEVTAHCGDDRSAASLETFMESVAAKYPIGTVYIVWDNLNIHYDGKAARWTRFQRTAWPAIRLCLHPQTCLVGQSDRNLLQHRPSQMSAPWQFCLDRRLATDAPGLHRALEPGPGASVPLDLHRLSAALGHRRMTKPSPPPATRAPDADVATAFCTAIGALGDYAHVTVRPRRGLLYVYADETEDAVARFHPLGDGTYGLSFHHHSGAWQPMPFSGDLHHITAVLVDSLGPVNK
jgi:transposase